ncbi:MAG: CHAT domain-containing protein [Alphaproteobacteria bacterium]|nr:CHAT domain-containing protein [Alphaproteobacteria bacterium]
MMFISRPIAAALFGLSLVALTGPAFAQSAPPATGGMQASPHCAKFSDKEREQYQAYMRVGARRNVEENFTSAEQNFRQALALHQKVCGRDDPGQTDALIHLALQISNQARFDEADPMFARADRMARGTDALVAVRAQHYKAVHLANQGKDKEAIDLALATEKAYFALAPELVALLDYKPTATSSGSSGLGAPRQRFADPRAHQRVIQGTAVSGTGQLAAQGISELMRLRALLALNLDQPAEARSLSQHAASLLAGVGIDPGGVRWRAIRVAGLGAADEKRFSVAVADLSDSARGLNTQLKNSQPAGRTFMDAGRAQLAQGNVGGAISEFRRGAEVLRAERNLVPAEAVEPYLTALMRQNSPNSAREMFDAAQLIRNGLTANFLAAAAVRLGDSNQQVAALQAIETELASLAQRRDNAVNRNADQATIDGLDSQIDERRLARNKAEEAVRASLPNYFQLIQGQPRASDVLAVLRPDEGFVQIVLGQDRSFGFLLTHGEVQVWSVSLTLGQAEAEVSKLRGAFTPNARGELPQFDVAAAHDLFKRLLGPATRNLKPLKALTISTNGALQSLPFSVLVTEAPPAIGAYEDYRKVNWLARWFATSYVPAPQSFVLLRRNASVSRAPSAYAGYGGFSPIPVGSAARIIASARNAPQVASRGCDSDARELASLPILPLAKTEVELAAKQLPGAQTHIGPQFNRASLLRGGLDRFKVIHFVAHALLPAELKCLQQPLLLTGTSSDAVTAADIAALKLDADLVVLSACNTAGADGRSAGEAFSGLVRAFFTAGTRGLMASHWSVVDESTTLMMVNMLGRIGKGARAPGVLRDAQISLLDGKGEGDLKEWAHPFYWAPFVFVGNAPAG